MKFSSDAHAAWEKFLNPDSLKQNLLIGGLYLAAFEMLKQSLVGRPKDFFWNGFRNGEDVISPEYQTKVLDLHKHPYTASALWWKLQGAIDDSDIIRLTEVREHRDQIAHNLPQILGTIEHSVREDLLCSMYELLSKIDNWWIRNIEIPINPDFEDRDFTTEELDGAASLNTIFLSLMLQVAAGDDTRLRAIYEMWMSKKKAN